jgi:universal stress protein E
MPFKNILVGVDLHHYHPETAQPSAAASSLVEQALWLAHATGGRLTFFSAVMTLPETLPHLEEADRHHVARTVGEAAAAVLAGLVARAQALGIQAGEKLAQGRPWQELIRQVLREPHDLLLIGASDRTGVARMFFGSTPERVLRYCPCPVWVTRPGVENRPPSILVADDLHPVGEQALAAAVDLAAAVGAPVHLLHVLYYPLDRLWVTGLPSEREQAYRAQVKDHAREVLKGQVEHVGGKLPHPVRLHLADDPGGLPDEAILECIAREHIDLVVMGSGDRPGLFGTLMGNAAERMLPHLPCGLLAVKPADFVSPVTLA